MEDCISHFGVVIWCKKYIIQNRKEIGEKKALENAYERSNRCQFDENDCVFANSNKMYSKMNWTENNNVIKKEMIFWFVGREESFGRLLFPRAFLFLLCGLSWRGYGLLSFSLTYLTFSLQFFKVGSFGTNQNGEQLEREAREIQKEIKKRMQ